MHFKRGVRWLLTACTLAWAASAAQAQTTPTIRGVVIGTDYTLFANNYNTGPDDRVLVGRKTPSPAPGTPDFIRYKWRFGYRPDIPQAAGAEVPSSYGPDGISGNADDWPAPEAHVSYNPVPFHGPILPPVDLFTPGRTTLYDKNVGLWPGGDALSVTTKAGAPVAVNNSPHWGGFYGVLTGSNGSRTLTAAPWSSPGSDFGVNNIPFTPGNAVENFYIYDIEGSIAVADGNGHLTYDLNSAPDPTVGTHKARGRLILRRKDYSARYLYGLAPPIDTNTNTLLIQGLWELVSAEGTFHADNGGPFTAADLGKAVGTWGQPNQYFDGVLYNDFTYRNHFPETAGQVDPAPAFMKYLAYQFQPASLEVKRKYDPCEKKLCIKVTNTGDVTLYDITLTDTLLTSPVVHTDPLAPGQSATHCIELAEGQHPDGTANATASTFDIPRATDNQGATATKASGVDVASGDDIQVTATTSATSIVHCTQICGYVYEDLDCDGKLDDGEPGIKGVTVKLYDDCGNYIKSVCTDEDGSYCFMGLKPDKYYIKVCVPGSYEDSHALPGEGGFRVSDTVIGVCATKPGDYSPQNFLLCKKTIKICGQVFKDLDCDGCLDRGEPALKGICVQLFDKHGNKIAQTTTDSCGIYCFRDLAPGEYKVKVVIPSGYKESNALPGEYGYKVNDTTICVKATKSGKYSYSCHNFLICKPVVKVKICGTVYKDRDCDGCLDRGDSVFPCVKVRLYTTDYKLLCEDTTDSCGNFCFSNLPPGDYIIKVVVPYGYDATNALPGDGGCKISSTKIRVSADKDGKTTYDSHKFLLCKKQDRCDD